MQEFYTLSVAFMIENTKNRRWLTRALKTLWILMLIFDVFLMLETRVIFSPFTFLTLFILGHYVLYKIHQKMDLIQVEYYEIMKITFTGLLCFLMHLETINNLPLGLVISIIFL